MQVQPYLFFEGRCEEAVEFYRKALGAEVMMMLRYKDSPEPHRPGSVPPGTENNVMHMSMRIGSTTVFASDGRSSGNANFNGFSLSIAAADVAGGQRYFAALSDGGEVSFPFGKTFFSPGFGMVKDKFGVHWMVLTGHSTAAREIITTRLFDAPRELVFAAWTNPKHVAQWWGPNGFTNTIEQMDVRPGGVWKFVMHGPDGVDYQNKSIYLEVVKPSLIVYSHVSGPKFDMTATFDDEGGKTRVTMRMVFDSAGEREMVDKKFGAVEGAKQTLARLGEFLARSR